MNYKSVTELAADHPNLAEFIENRETRIKKLSTALRDALSTFNDKAVFVSHERLEAWQQELLRNGVP